MQRLVHRTRLQLLGTSEDIQHIIINGHFPILHLLLERLDLAQRYVHRAQHLKFCRQQRCYNFSDDQNGRSNISLAQHLQRHVHHALQHLAGSNHRMTSTPSFIQPASIGKSLSTSSTLSMPIVAVQGASDCRNQ